MPPKKQNPKYQFCGTKKGVFGKINDFWENFWGNDFSVIQSEE